VAPNVSGLTLARDYWFEIVAPLVDPIVPASRRAAALLGEGSEVLGFDTEQSTDHGFGPRVFVFVGGLDAEARRDLAETIARALPERFRGHPTRFARSDGAPSRHQVLLTTVADEFDRRLGCDVRAEITADAWLRMPTQQLRALTAGEVFEDGTGELSDVRRRLAWYPDDVWLYVLACQWRRIAQEEAFVGRCGQVGDELGSALVSARLVRDVMRLCFLVEREYAPYSKWLGTAFARLPCGSELLAPMRAALSTRRWRERERRLTTVMESVAGRFNTLGVTEALDVSVRPFHRRPFVVLDAHRFAEACMRETPLRRRGWIGAVDQFVDSTDVLSYPDAVRAVTRGTYESHG
jgi:hypothetical protein